MQHVTISPNDQKSVTRYDPEAGMKTIYAAEAEIKYYTRTQNLAELDKSVEKLIVEQADYVVWRDATARPAHRPKKNSSSTERVSSRPSYDPGDVAAHRWRKKFCTKNGSGTKIDPTKLKEAIVETQRRCRRACDRKLDRGIHQKAGVRD